MTPPAPLVVAKLGGSLLDRPEWPDRLRAYLRSRPGDRVVLVVGGGRFADALRDLDRIHALGEGVSHALALRVLDVTARLAAALLPGVPVLADPADLATTPGPLAILAPRRLLDLDDRTSPDPLPHAWATTTDSIAARVAARLGAAELVLLKSCPLPPAVATWDEATAVGLVDPVFPRVLPAGLRVTWVDLRAVPALPEQVVEGGGGVGGQPVEPGGGGADDGGGGGAGEAVGVGDLAGGGPDQDGAG